MRVQAYYLTQPLILRAIATAKRRVVEEFRSSDLPLRTQAFVQQVLKAAAQRVKKLVQE